MASAHSPTVLIVDDEPLIRWAVARTLTAAGCSVQEAGSAAEAMQCLGRSSPDVVLMDYRLPDTRGFSLVSAIRTLSPRSVIVMMTAEQSDVTAAAQSYGVSAVMQKPFDMSAVESEVLTRARLRRAI
jgi:two-component system nitrogen regulation response regulator GlnG